MMLTPLSFSNDQNVINLSMGGTVPAAAVKTALEVETAALSTGPVSNSVKPDINLTNVTSVS